jgi:hypothetical protein
MGRLLAVNLMLYFKPRAETSQWFSSFSTANPAMILMATIAISTTLQPETSNCQP